MCSECKCYYSALCFMLGKLMYVEKATEDGAMYTVQLYTI